MVNVSRVQFFKLIGFSERTVKQEQKAMFEATKCIPIRTTCKLSTSKYNHR